MIIIIKNFVVRNELFETKYKNNENKNRLVKVTPTSVMKICCERLKLAISYHK